MLQENQTWLDACTVLMTTLKTQTEKVNKIKKNEIRSNMLGRALKTSLSPATFSSFLNQPSCPMIPQYPPHTHTGLSGGVGRKQTPMSVTLRLANSYICSSVSAVKKSAHLQAAFPSSTTQTPLFIHCTWRQTSEGAVVTGGWVMGCWVVGGRGWINVR